MASNNPSPRTGPSHRLMHARTPPQRHVCSFQIAAESFFHLTDISDSHRLLIRYHHPLALSREMAIWAEKLSSEIESCSGCSKPGQGASLSKHIANEKAALVEMTLSSPVTQPPLLIPATLRIKLHVSRQAFAAGGQTKGHYSVA